MKENSKELYYSPMKGKKLWHEQEVEAAFMERVEAHITEE